MNKNKRVNKSQIDLLHFETKTRKMGKIIQANHARTNSIIHKLQSRVSIHKGKNSIKFYLLAILDNGDLLEL